MAAPKTYRIASTSANLSTFFRSYCKNVVRAFLFFFFGVLVLLKLLAYRIDWCDIEAMRGTSALEVAINGVASLHKAAAGEAVILLKEPINDRGWAIAAIHMSWAVAVVPKVRSEIRECQDTKRR